MLFKRGHTLITKSKPSQHWEIFKRFKTKRSVRRQPRNNLLPLLRKGRWYLTPLVFLVQLMKQSLNVSEQNRDVHQRRFPPQRYECA
jgi:hypothetical protein